MVSFSLKAIVEGLPKELQASVAKPPGKEEMVKLSLAKVVEQLARGSVKLTLGELKQLAPGATFTADNSNDQSLVAVPLKEVLARVNPASLKRRPNQVEVQVSDDIKAVFGAESKHPAPPAKPAAPAPAPVATPAAPAPTPAPAPVVEQTPVKPAAPLPELVKLATAPKPVPPTTPPAPVESAPIKPIAPLPEPPKSAPKPAPLPTPQPAVAPPAPASAPAAAAPVLRPMAAPAADTGNLLLALESFVATLPEALKSAIGTQNAFFSIPVEDVEPQMKRGKVNFQWKQLRAWSKPSLPASLGSASDEAVIELPLKAIIPLFMAARKPAASQKTVAVAENIPDVFAAKLGMTAAAAPTPPPAPAPAPVAAAAPAPTLASPASAPVKTSALGELLGQPGKLDWTPAEVVQKTAVMEGVAGVIFTTQDGLKVASQLPAEINADAFAGFVPAIFSRVNQYTKELNLGETTQLKVQAGNKPLHIFKTPKLYFAVLGRAGETAPEAKLAKIAALLDR